MSVLCPLSGQLILYPDRMERLVGAAVWVFLAGTTTPVPVTSDPVGAIPHQFPFRVASDGLIPNAYWGEGPFRVVVTYNTSGAEPNFNNDIVLIDMDYIQGEIIVTPGGGGGGDVPLSERVQTGMAHWEPIDGVKTGYVRLNGRAIGDASSGGTERANADCENLFAYLWNAVTNDFAAVSGGRGANAAADWAAHKTITLPSLRGAIPIGLDTMGNSYGAVSQVVTNLTTVQNSGTATVGSSAAAARITRGMYILSANVPAGAVVTSVDGVTITMSLTASLGGTAATRFSQIRDAQQPGAAGGSLGHTQVENELAEHDHPLPDHNHTTSVGSIPILRATGGTNGLVASGGTIGSGTLTINGASLDVPVAGKGSAMNIMQPSVAGTWYIKL